MLSDDVRKAIQAIYNEALEAQEREGIYFLGKEVFDESEKILLAEGLINQSGE